MTQSAPTSVEALRALLRGEQMAIGVYAAVIDDVTDPDVKKKLQEVCENHVRHAQDLEARIAKLGGEPNGGADVSDWTAKASIRLKGWYQENPAALLRQVYHGEDQGINAAANIAAERLDAESQALVERILGEEKQHLDRLAEIISRRSCEV